METKLVAKPPCAHSKTAIPVIEDGKEARFLFLPDGEDPDSLVRQEGEIAFSERLSTAQPLSEFFFKSHSETADLDSMDGRARFSTEVLPAINSMRPSLLQQMMLDRICELTNLSLDQIQTTVNFHEALTITTAPASQSTSDAYSPPPALEYDNYPSEEPHYADFEYSYQEPNQEQPSKKKGKFKNVYKKDKFVEQSGPRLPRPRNTELSFAEKLISLLLHYPQIANEYTPPQSLSQTESKDIQLLIQLITYYTENPSASLGQLAVDWREDEKLSQTIISLYEISTSLEIHSEEDARLYLKDAKNQLELIALEQEISTLQRKQQQTGKLSTEEKILLAQNFQKINRLKHITKE